MTTWTTDDVALLNGAKEVLAVLGYELGWTVGTQGIRWFAVRSTSLTPWRTWDAHEDVYLRGRQVLAELLAFYLAAEGYLYEGA